MKHKKRAGSTKNTNMTQNGDKCKWISHLVSTSSMSDIYSSLQTGTKTQMKKQKKRADWTKNTNVTQHENKYK